MPLSHFSPPDSNLSDPSAGSADHAAETISASATDGSAKRRETTVNSANVLQSCDIPVADQYEVIGFPRFPQGVDSPLTGAGEI